MRSFAMFALVSLIAAVPVQATAGDTQSGRVKASQCQGCHGPRGVSVAPIYPNLAGQKEIYLRKALRDYKTGARRDAQCSSIARTLSQADIDDLAAYFASLK